MTELVTEEGQLHLATCIDLATRLAFASAKRDIVTALDLGPPKKVIELAPNADIVELTSGR
ncbi:MULTISPECIES: hypothetical protein [unclassified Streptomyces]|uniref:hypothetical protein n=1 Tax=unclassified Streptomyces TaxID=2593676 RepID=UPI00403C688A